jgi:hypothetical protein
MDVEPWEEVVCVKPCRVTKYEQEESPANFARYRGISNIVSRLSEKNIIFCLKFSERLAFYQPTLFFKKFVQNKSQDFNIRC